VEGAAGMTPSVEEIRAWIVARISHLTAVPPAEVDVEAPLTRYGLDSVAMIALAADLEKWLGLRFRENPLADNPTTESLAHTLAEQVKKKTAG
jgi:acyl carrier protein